MRRPYSGAAIRGSRCWPLTNTLQRILVQILTQPKRHFFKKAEEPVRGGGSASGRRQLIRGSTTTKIFCLEGEAVTQVAAIRNDASNGCSLGFVRDQCVDEVELVHGYELKDFVAHATGRVARQGFDDL